MFDIEKSDGFLSTSSLSKLGVTAVGYTAGGIFVLLLNSIASTWFGLVVGAVVCLFGLGSFRSKDPVDRKAGFIVMAAGILVFLSKVPLVAPIASALLVVSGIGLLVMGIRNAIKFIIGLRKRS